MIKPGACADRRRRCGWCSRRARSSRTWAAKSATVKPPGAMASARAAASTARIRGLFRSMPPVRVAPIWAGSGSSSSRPSGMNPMSTQSSMVQNRSAMPASRATISGNFSSARPACAGLGVVHDRLEPQHVLAFGIALQRQQPEMDLEQRQVIRRSLDHDCQLRRRLGPVPRGRFFIPNRVRSVGTSSRDRVRSATVSNTPVHLRAGGEDQVAAVLGLVDRVGVAEPAGLLVGQVQPEAQARGVDPPVADLAQPPYSRSLRQGVCDLGQAARIRDPVKQLPSFVKPIPAACAWQATYSWPLRMTCAPNGGCPDILIVMCPQAGSMM